MEENFGDSKSNETLDGVGMKEGAVVEGKSTNEGAVVEGKSTNETFDGECEKKEDVEEKAGPRLTKEKKTTEEGFDISGKLVFGASSLAGMFEPISEQQVYEVIEAAIVSGIREFDTAPHYGCGLSEQRLGQALRKYILEGQKKVVIKDRVDLDEIKMFTKVGRVVLHRPEGKFVDDILYAKVDVDEENIPGSPSCIFPETSADVVPVFDYTDRGIYHSYRDSVTRIGMNIWGLRVHDLQSQAHFEAFMGLGDTNGLVALLDLRMNAKKIKEVSVGSNDIYWTRKIIFACEAGEINSILLANCWNLIDHPEEALKLFQICKDKNISVTNAGVFASGVLASSYTESIPLKEGDHVEARYRKRQEWSPAVIAAVRGVDVYDLEFDNGDFEGDVEKVDDEGIEVVRRVVREHMYKYSAIDENKMKVVNGWMEVCKSFGVPLPAVALHFALLPSSLIHKICVGFKHKDEVLQVREWLGDVKVPLELWKAALDKKLLAKYAFDFITIGVYDCRSALESAESVLKSRANLVLAMRLPQNTISVIGQRFYDARDTIADFVEKKMMGVEGELVVYINHGKSVVDAPNKSKLRAWILEAYKNAKFVEPDGNEFTRVEFDLQ